MREHRNRTTMDHDDFHTTERIASRRRTGRPSLRGRTLPPPSYAVFPISLAETSAGNRAGFRHPAGYHAGSIPAAPTKTPNSPTRTAMPTASDTPARPKPETAVGKTPAVPIRSLHDKALKSLARRMAGYTQKEIKTIYEYDPDGTRRIKSETVIRKQVGPDLAAITFGADQSRSAALAGQAGNRSRRLPDRLERLERRGPARNRRNGNSLIPCAFRLRNRRHCAQSHLRPQSARRAVPVHLGRLRKTRRERSPTRSQIMPRQKTFAENPVRCPSAGKPETGPTAERPCNEHLHTKCRTDTTRIRKYSANRYDARPPPAHSLRTISPSIRQVLP